MGVLINEIALADREETFVLEFVARLDRDLTCLSFLGLPRLAHASNLSYTPAYHA